MKAAILTIGSELLTGRIVDTNAKFLAFELARRGIRVVIHLSVDDRPDEISDALAVARSRADLILITGGLGPTVDDITSCVVAKLLGRRLVEDPGAAAAIREWYLRRGMEPHAGAMRQAMVPEGARAIANPVGIAPGFMIKEGRWTMAAFPGVPAEMRAMAEMSVLPGLESEGTPTASRVLRFAGISESAVDLGIKEVWESLRADESFALQAAPAEVRLRIAVSGDDPAGVRLRLGELEDEVRSRLAAHLFGCDEDELETVVIGLLRSHGSSLAAAESITGGLVAQRLTRVPGASRVFHGSVVAYMEKAKREWLGVPAELLAEKGAVSRETAAAMAENVRKRAATDIGLSTTGFAGPGGGAADDPVGTVYIGIADAQGVHVERGVFGGDRDAVRSRASSHALYLVWRLLVARSPK